MKSSFMDMEHLQFLTSEVGKQALAKAMLLPTDRLTRLTRLRREYAPHLASGIVELLELRQRARVKFAHADQMFFTPEGLEQSTGETIARYRAVRFPAGVDVLDACCGIGGDALALARRASVLAVDSNPAAAVCVLANARILSALESTFEYDQVSPPDAVVHALCADVTTLDLARLRDQGIGAAFFDPSRRMDTREGRKRARNSEDYLPPLSWMNALESHFPFVGVKVSPAIDDATLLKLTGHGAIVEFIAEGNGCKEAVLWCGGAADALRTLDTPALDEPYCATIVGKDGTSNTLRQHSVDVAALSDPLDWLFEPNPAAIRAHLTPQIALEIRGAQMDRDIAYLTANYSHPTPFATAYKILDWMPFHVKNIQSWLRTKQRRVAVVKKRGVDLEPDDVRKKLASPALAENPPIVLVLMRRKEQTLAILCEPPQV